jgi:predicted kinase
MLSITIYRGAPGSGKSTRAKADGNKIIIEADQFFMVAGSYLYDKARGRDAREWCLSTVRYHLFRGEDVAVANTLLRQHQIEDYVWIARDFSAKIKVIDCHGTYDSIHSVPKNIVDVMRKTFEAVTIPEDVAFGQ